MQKTAALDDLTEVKERLDVKSSEESFKWLTEHSRNFLASGYLSPGISAEERIQLLFHSPTTSFFSEVAELCICIVQRLSPYMQRLHLLLLPQRKSISPCENLENSPTNKNGI